MTKEDYEVINNIYNISLSILENYYKMMELEIRGLVGNKDYNSLITIIEQQIILENSLYEKIDNSKYEEIINYLSKENNSTLLESISSKDYSVLIKNRIIKRLTSKNNAFKENNINNILDYLNATTNDINNSLEKDFINTILCILNECLNNHEFANYKHYLLLFKYNLAFLYDYVEEDLLKNSFAINSDLYWISNGVASISRFIGIEGYRKNFVREIDVSCLRVILDDEKGELDYKDLVHYIVLRTSNLFEGEEFVNKFKECLNIAYKSEDTNHSGILNQRLNLYLNAYDCYELDKEKPRIINLNI